MAYTKFIIYLTMAGMVISGALSGITIKLTNKTVSLGEYFHHPFFQWVPMFIGEMLWFVFVWFTNYQDKKKYGDVKNTPDFIEAEKQGLKTEFHPLILSIPMLWDWSASVLLMIGYIHIAASIAQMIGSLIVFVTAIEAILFLNKVLFRHHWVGAFWVVSGICLVAFAALSEDNEVSGGNAFIGVTWMVLSAVMQGTQFAIEEKMLRTYYLQSFQFAGWEGLWGLLLLLITLPILQFIPWEAELCNDGYVENSIFAMEQIWNSPRLILLTLSSIIIICLYNGLGMAVTKMISSTNRVVLRQIKIFLIWLFFLAYPYDGNESFKPLQLIGFIILVFGVFLYNEVIVLHFWGLADHLDIQKDKEDKHDQDYIEFEDTSKVSKS